MKIILELVQSLPLTTKEFQHTQTELAHDNILDHAPIGCAHEDALAEILSGVRFGVVLDKHTSWSRTTWRAGVVETSPILVVLDTTNTEGVNRASIDIWTDLQGISETILRRVQQSQMGAVPDTYGLLEIAWGIETSEDSGPYLRITLSPPKNPHSQGAGDVYFSVEYQRAKSETFKTTYPLAQEQVSIAIEIGKEESQWDGSLDSSFLILFFSDSEWKSNERLHQVRFTWRDALIRQLERHLEKGTRLTSFSNVSTSMNLDDTPDGKNARDLFYSFCLESVVEGCKSQRVSDHCRRCVILT